MSGLLRVREDQGDAPEFWRRWEGRTIAEKFLLQSYLGGSDDSAVFLTSIQAGGGKAEQAAIKLLRTGLSNVESVTPLARWVTNRELNHPNLIRIFQAGRCEIDGTAMMYVVQEYAEENLSQILPERALTPEETRAILPPILEALQYLHDKGIAHGHIQPSNILAKTDVVKLSSDGLISIGEKSDDGVGSDYAPPEGASAAASPASDVWRLGITLVEVMTQNLPAWDRTRSKSPEIPRSMPEPFREIARQCLKVEPSKRWTITQLQARLDTEHPGEEKSESAQSGLALVQAESVPNESKISDREIRSSASGKVQSENVVGENKSRQGGSARIAETAPHGSRIENASPAFIPTAKREPPKWIYLLIVAAVVAVALFLMLRAKGSTHVSSSATEVQPAQSNSVQSTGPAPASNTTPASASSPQAQQTQNRSAVSTSQPGASQNSVSENKDSQSNELAAPGVVHRAEPDVSATARHTIHGRIVVRVRTKVDAAGDVTKATLLSGHTSKYFSRVALDAARDWKFSPGAADREWNLQFAFTRAKTEISEASVNR